MNKKAKDGGTRAATFPASEVNIHKPTICFAIVGGGKECALLLQNLYPDGFSRLNMELIAIADRQKDAPGYAFAEKSGLSVFTDYRRLFQIKGLNLIVELTGSDPVAKEIYGTKPDNISFIDHSLAHLIFSSIFSESPDKLLDRISMDICMKRKEKTQTVLDSLPYRVMVVNRDMTISMVNHTFLREKNLTWEEAIGKYCYQVRYGLKRPCWQSGMTCYLKEVKEKGEIVSSIHEYRDEKGEQRFDVITASAILDDTGKITQLLEASRDVTKRIKLEKDAQKSNVFLQNVIQSTVDGIVVVDTRGYVLLFNEGMERLTGYTAEEITAKGHVSYFYDIDVARENMKKMRSSRHGPVGKLNPISMSVTTKQGEEIPVTLSASVITIDGKEVGSVGVFTDMREVLKMRKDLEEAHLQLVQSEKIASVGKMAAGVAHEINNPLSGILLYAELLKENLVHNQQHMSDIQEIIDQTLRCKKIVSELLEFSRHSVGKVSSFSLKKLITKCMDLLINQAIFHDIDVTTDIDGDMPDIVGDMGQLQQVFTNLFINAADAMHGKGRLDIHASYNHEKGSFRVLVADTGPGIPVRVRDKIFDIFFTTKPTGKGTGLGLSISQNIIKLHGGTISAQCPPEGGTTFVIEIPREYMEPFADEEVFIGMEGP